jgi:hypothetical protein
LFDFRQAKFNYEPYPIGLIRPILDPALHASLCATYPDKALFEFKPSLGNKYSLSEVNNADKYRRFINSSAHWNQLYRYVKSKEFIPGVLGMLKQHHIDLGLGRYRVVSTKAVTSRASALSRVLRVSELSARFEFSMMGADGGHISPHTDAQQKLITLVISMMQPGEWNPAWGGGTDVVMPRDRTLIYNQVNKPLPFAEVEVIKTFACDPNQCVIFVKTFNSWHSVSPMLGQGSSALRKTLTINIEAKT